MIELEWTKGKDSLKTTFALFSIVVHVTPNRLRCLGQVSGLLQWREIIPDICTIACIFLLLLSRLYRIKWIKHGIFRDFILILYHFQYHSFFFMPYFPNPYHIFWIEMKESWKFVAYIWHWEWWFGIYSPESLSRWTQIFSTSMDLVSRIWVFFLLLRDGYMGKILFIMIWINFCN